MPYYKGFQEQKDAIKKLQQATNPETPILYREFIHLASTILNCSFKGSYNDGKMTYSGLGDNVGLRTYDTNFNEVTVTDNVVYIKK